MTPEFWITIAAIVIGPLIAVLTTNWLNKKSDAKQRKLFVFRTLMSTRRTPLSVERVQALNLVEIEFWRDAAVMKKFRELLGVYNDVARWRSDDEAIKKQLWQDNDDQTVKLLKEIGRALGYKLENLDLLRGGYYPEAFRIVDGQQSAIREFLVGLNDGSKLLPTAVVDVRHPEELLKQARETQFLISSVEEDGARVK